MSFFPAVPSRARRATLFTALLGLILGSLLSVVPAATADPAGTGQPGQPAQPGQSSQPGQPAQPGEEGQAQVERDDTPKQNARVTTASISTGGQSTCFVKANGNLRCMGENAWGQVGDGTNKDRLRSVQIGGAEWKSVSTSGATTCAVKLDSTLWCWGMNSRGQLGQGERGQKWKPAKVGGYRNWDQVSAGWLHTCAVNKGSLWCWGDNSYGQIGDGTRATRLSPVRVGRDLDWASVSADGWTTCATKTNGAAFCWGRNDYGQIGNGGTATKLRPVKVAGDAAFASIDVTWSGTCGVTTSGAGRCWGQNAQGQLGDGSTSQRSLTPSTVKGSQQWASISAGEGHTCAMDTDKQAWCWGGDRYGQLGDAGTQSVNEPKLVASNGDWLAVSAGWMHSCGLAASDVTGQCWGNNEQGQLGRGNREDQSTPPGVKVASPRMAAPKATKDVKVTTFNILGSQHTSPGGGATNYAPGRIRGEWSAAVLHNYGSSIVGFQEMQKDQYEAVKQSMADRYSFYPDSSGAGKVVWQSIMWDSSQWDFVGATQIMIPKLGKERPMPMVRLKSKLNNRNIWVLNAHHTAGRTKQRQAERNRSVRLEIAKINGQRSKKLPVIFLGDMNEREPVYCKVTRNTDLRAAQGGGTNPCRMPKRTRFDWIFTSPEFSKQGTKFDRSSAIQRLTDHTVVTALTNVPGAK